MNSNISKGKWEFLEDSHSFKIDSDNGLIATIIPNQTQVFKGTCRGNFKAICNAINNTYGKGIDPTLLPDIMRENERLNKTVNDLLETGSSKLSIKQRQELESENEELKKGIKYAEKVAFDTSKQNADLMVKCETYKKDYDSMVAEVVKLSGEKSELLEALKSTRSLNLSLHEQDTVGNRVYKKVESAITKATK